MGDLLQRLLRFIFAFVLLSYSILSWGFAPVDFVPNTEQTLSVTKTAWLIFLLIIFFSQKMIPMTVIYASLTAYCILAEIAFTVGKEYFPPYPTLDVIQTVTLTDLQCIIVSFLLVELFFGNQNLSKAIISAGKKTAHLLSQVSNSPIRFILYLILLVLGVTDWLALSRIGMSAISASERRSFTKAFLLSSDHNLQVLAMTASIAVAVIAITSKKRLVPILLLAFAWAPFVLSGSRKEVVFILGATALVAASYGYHRFIGVIGAGAIVLLCVPMFFGGNIWDSLHEYILPQYTQFTLQMGLIDTDFAGSFFDRIQFLVPNFLRLSEPIDMAIAFYETGITNVGLGMSPFTEAATITSLIPLPFVYSALFIGWMFILWASRYVSPFLTVTIFAQLLFAGRSDTWIALFFPMYTALLLQLIATLSNKEIF